MRAFRVILTQRQLRVLAALDDVPRGAAEIGKAIGWSTPVAQRELSRLEALGETHKVPSPPGGDWPWLGWVRTRG